MKTPCMSAVNLQLAEAQQRRPGAGRDELQKEAALLRREFPQNFHELDYSGAGRCAALVFGMRGKIFHVPVAAVLARNNGLQRQT